MLNILSNQGNANQNNSLIPPHTSQMAKIKNSTETGKDVDKEEYSSIVGGIVSLGTTILEISLAVPQKIGHSII